MKALNGMDVSDWQDYFTSVEDFKKAKEQGYDVVIVKLGESYNETECGRTQILNAIEAGLKVGVYYFSHAYDLEECRKEAQWVINKLNEIGLTPWHLQAGIWYDYEDHTRLRSYINNGNLSYQDITNIMCEFVNILNREGFPFVGIYSGYSLLWDETYMYSQAPWVPLWVAQYNNECDYPKESVAMWQYTDRGDVCGHEMDVSEVYRTPWEKPKQDHKCTCGCDCCSK